MQEIINLPNSQATLSFGQQLGETLTAGTTLLLKGELGAGKTTLVQGIGTGLGIHEPIVSPTFTLINEYLEGRIPLYHLDLYRLNPQETRGLYLENYWEGIETPLGITVIEWPERLAYKPNGYLWIELVYLAQNGRKVVINDHRIVSYQDD
ncbi:MAG: tRNA (adenosine(37)-N6)-threonylcarbamoyltransferase complex ATPase subunit type 1 TsaE [Microcystaceae cyanobacterium]